MRPRQLVLDLLRKDEHWLRAFRAFCQAGPLRLRSQAWQFREALEARGEPLPRDSDLEDALFGLARDLLPKSPAAEWDTEWADGLCKDALAEMEQAYATVPGDRRSGLDLRALDPGEDRMVTAGKTEDRAAFKAAVAEWRRAGAAAVERAACEAAERRTRADVTQREDATP